jgi:hypothetical protein
VGTPLPPARGDVYPPPKAIVFKRMRDWPFIAAPTWAFGVTAFHVIQDHPAYIPCGQRWPLRPELAAPLGVWPSSQLTRCAGGRASWRLSGDVAVPCCCTAPAPSAKTPATVLAGRPSAFRPDTQRLCPTAPGICPVTTRTFQGMAQYPGQARCLALGFWPECFRRLNVKGGRRAFPKETRSALDIEGKHVTIQGPSLALSQAGIHAPRMAQNPQIKRQARPCWRLMVLVPPLRPASWMDCLILDNAQPPR